MVLVLALLLYLTYLGRGAWEGASVVAMLASYISTSQSAYSTPQSCRSRLGQSPNLFHALYYGQIPMPLPKDHGFFDIRLKSLKKSMISWSKFFITKAFLAVIRSEMVKYPPLIVAKLGEGFPKKRGGGGRDLHKFLSTYHKLYILGQFGDGERGGDPCPNCLAHVVQETSGGP